MSISKIIRDEADQKRYERYERLKRTGFIPPRPQTMSLHEVRRIIGVEEFHRTTSKRYPQIVDLEEF